METFSGILNFTQPITNSFLVDIIIWLVKISSSIALGIILFTVILKLITLPFDFMSRASMRKNSLKMEEMRPELEKLQKQYADNKDLYNQKMMALYKKNGYSMFGACLPTILTLIIFIVAINAFTDYSKFQNKMDFYSMSQSYNNVLYAGFDIDDNYIVRNERGEIVVKDYELYTALEDTNSVKIENINVERTIVAEGTSFITITTDGGYSKYKRSYTKNEDGSIKWGAIEVSAIEDANLIKNSSLASEENNFLKNSNGDTYEQALAKLKDGETLTVDAFINDIQSYMAALRYRQEQSSFLWIKNIWVTDSPTKHPVESNWETFRSTHSYSGNNIGESGYAKLIAHLDEEVNAPNGYFILVILTAGLSLLSQIVMSKSQKAQMELQTVDGQGAQTQKIMTWMMPIMMAVFAFMYTSAFSIYIILSTVISMLTTFGINFIVDRKFKKEKKETETGVIRGRVYTPKEEEKEKKVEKKGNDDKVTGDFLSGTADKKKHIRGRIK